MDMRTGEIHRDLDKDEAEKIKALEAITEQEAEILEKKKPAERPIELAVSRFMSSKNHVAPMLRSSVQAAFMAGFRASEEIHKPQN